MTTQTATPAQTNPPQPNPLPRLLDWLHRAAAARGQTQAEVAAGLGVMRAYLRELEAGRRLRRLTPEELEALNGFPCGFTAVPGITPGRRGFLMGNALVTGLVARLGQALCDVRAPACGIPDETTSEKYKTVLYA